MARSRPRIVYPLVVLLFVSAITLFLIVAILPKYRRIFQEFDLDLPSSTLAIVDVGNAVADAFPLVPLAMVLGLIALSAVIAHPTLRWHAPLLGRLYRWGVQAQVLRALGRLLAAGRTVPHALGFLGAADDFPAVVRRRLTTATEGVERGDPLAASLNWAELLPAAMGGPLVVAAEKVRTLPWALAELGDHLSGRAFRLVRRASLIASPLLVVAVGVVVAYIAIGMFMPLIALMSSLSE